MAHILSISYSPTLLLTRELLLQQVGHSVVSAEGFAKAYRACEDGRHFDLVILGHSIPRADKEEIIKRCKQTCCCPVLALLRPNEGNVEGATRCIDSDEPRVFIDAVQDMIASTHV